MNTIKSQKIFLLETLCHIRWVIKIFFYTWLIFFRIFLKVWRENVGQWTLESYGFYGSTYCTQVRFALRNIMCSRICRKYGQSKRISALPIRIHRCDCAHVRNASSSVPVRGMCHASSASRYSRLAFYYQWFDQPFFWCNLLTILTIATLVNWQKIDENWEKNLRNFRNYSKIFRGYLAQGTLDDFRLTQCSLFHSLTRC